MTKIAVVVGSTRQGRQTDKLAKWVAAEIGKQAEVEVLDLRDYPMSFLDEAISPRYNPERVAAPETQKWLDKVAQFDGYVFVTPEYNRSTSAVLKNAIDVLGHEMDDKPVALVGHGSSGGAQAIASLRMALPGVGAVTVPQALFFSDRLAESIDDSGVLKQEILDRPYGPQTQLAMQAQSLIWYADALKAARK
ncbi:MAG TPA: NAD(P)H-dependent oxidoreductase [Candidatus Saccharimonadales bacterium]|nr:NAD(P)H-dependent oxidoreductase [Candidatus Saccharimonadales bacterium]